MYVVAVQCKSQFAVEEEGGEEGGEGEMGYLASFNALN